MKRPTTMALPAPMGVAVPLAPRPDVVQSLQEQEQNDAHQSCESVHRLSAHTIIIV